MSNVGRPPKSARLKLVQGNPGKRPIRREPRAPGELTKPAYLTGRAGEEWDRVIATAPAGILKPADEPVLAAYCVAWSTHMSAMALAMAATLPDENGVERPAPLRSIGSTGQEVAHPQLAVSARFLDIMLKCASQLGLSPVARARLDAPDEEEPDAIEKRYFG